MFEKPPEKLRKQRERVDRFIRDEIDTVPHLEALLLIWRSRPRAWAVAEIGKSLYITDEDSQTILEDLKRNGLIASGRDGSVYNPDSERDELLSQVDEIYRRELVRVSRMIHSKAPSSVREFARAFRFRLKD